MGEFHTDYVERKKLDKNNIALAKKSVRAFTEDVAEKPKWTLMYDFIWTYSRKCKPISIVTESRWRVTWGEKDESLMEERDYQEAWGNFGSPPSGLWQHIHGCIHILKLFRLYMVNMSSLLYANHPPIYLLTVLYLFLYYVINLKNIWILVN